MRERVLSRRAMALLAASLLSVSVPAAASRAAEERAPLDAAGVEAVLRRLGFRDIDRVQRRGGLYLADASAPEGQRLRLVVDAFSGELTGLRVLDGPVGRRGDTVRTSSN